MGRIRERHAKVSRQYDVQVERDPGTTTKRPGPNARAVRFSTRPLHDKADAGAYLLRTSRVDWNLQTSWNSTCRSRKSRPCSAP